MKTETEGRSFSSAFIGAPAEGPLATDCRIVIGFLPLRKIAKNAGVRNVQRPGDKAAHKNG